MRIALKNLIFTLLVPGTVAIYLPLLIAGSRSPTSRPAFVIGLALLVVGAATYAWCVWDFATFGRGTPAPIDAPKKLLVRGLYRYTRNPMYVGVLTVILGWAALFGTLRLILYAAVVGTCFHLVILLYEERHLRAEFGGQYEAYCSQVSRWLPRRRRGPAA